MNDNSLNETFLKRTSYQYNFNDYIEETIYYGIEEIEYNCKEDMVREKTKRMGKVDGDITYENIYDEKFNLIEKRLNRHFTDIDDVVVYLYENIYDEENKLIKTIEKDGEGNFLGTTAFEYSNGQLIKKETKYKEGFYKTISYYYDEEGRLYEQAILNDGELLYHYNYSILEDGRMRRTLVNPARGKYKWELGYGYGDKDSCTVDIYEPALTLDMIKEIMDYIIGNYKGIINCVIITIFNVNLLYRYENPEIYNYYRDNYGIVILEDF
ncbi:hypothetical protein [uncultured Tissierella sp.]|uniref:hypothetical protein n=1 Tax=uncultured Tissierella sp. TaxID=448160 RepID=UPI0028047F60|nr:hypothetical protein [uncultured Tissierella sp.]MDU5080957.1 hypothetical protein [Bacillota bacterium]